MNLRLFNKHRYVQEIEKLSTPRELGTRKKEKLTNWDFVKFKKKLICLFWSVMLTLNFLKSKQRET